MLPLDSILSLGTTPALGTIQSGRSVVVSVQRWRKV
jgi:hypothetical protein